MSATPRARFVASLLAYAALTLVIGRDVVSNLSTGIASDPGDPLLTASILRWNATHLPLTDAWWQFPIFHPTRETLTFSEHLLGLSAIAAPIQWLSGDTIVTYNLTALLTYTLSATTMYLLVYRLTGSAAGAFLAGLAYGFAPYRASQLGHIQVLAMFWAPLALLGLHAYLDTGRRRWLALFAASWALQAATNGYALVFLSVFVALWVVWFVVVPRNWKALGAITLASAAGMMPLVPILLRYAATREFHGFVRSGDEIQHFSADVTGVFCASHLMTFWSWLRSECRLEGELFPGALVAVLAGAVVVGGLRRTLSGARTPSAGSLRWVQRGLLALAVAYGAIALSVVVIGPWRVSVPFISASASSVAKPLTVMGLALVVTLLLSATFRAAARRGSVMGFYLVAALITWLLTLGPTIVAFSSSTEVPGPYRLLAMLPFVDGLRAPGRFWMMTTLCLAVVTGLSVARLLAGRSRRTAVVALMVFTAVLLVDSLNRIVAAPLPPPVPDPQALAGQVVIELPVGGGRDIAAQWRALEADAISVNGFSGYEPAYYRSLITAVELADAAGLRPFLRDRELHLVVDVAFPLLVEMVESQPGAVLIASNAWARQYRLARQGGRAAEAGSPIPIVAVQSACARQGDPPRAAIDRDNATTWICPPMNVPMELTIDLGAATSVGAFRQSLGPYTWHMPRAMTIETSLDGLTWAAAYEGSVLAAAIDSALATPRAASLLLSFPPREARYLRVRGESQLRDFHFTMAEAEVFAPK